MSKLKELEKRLRDEPDNLGLRVMVAGALHDAGRRADAVELYRSVAIAYRDQGRPQQAITVCRSILELAPDDAPCNELLAALLASQSAPREEVRPAQTSPPGPLGPGRQAPPPARQSPPPARLSPPPSVPRPTPPPLPRPSSPLPGELFGDAARRSSGELFRDAGRRSSGEFTPLPPPLPYHVADPSASSLPTLTRDDLPPSLQEELASYPEIAGIAAAARQISASLIAASPPDDEFLGDAASEPDTGRLPRGGIAAPPGSDPQLPTIDRALAALGESDDDPTLPPRTSGVARAGSVDEEKTEPRERPLRVRPPSIAPPTAATGPLASAFFAPVPPHHRAEVLQRFRRRMVASGMTVIRRGESGHGLVVVVRGRLELHGNRPDGWIVELGAIGPGEYIGEVSLLSRAPSHAEVVAATESEILVLAPDDFYEVAAAFPPLAAELKDVAERRTREHAQRLNA